MKRLVCAALAAGAIGAEAPAGERDGFKVSGYGSFDLASGYVLYGARETKDPCYWTYGELDLSYGRWGTVGAALWQNTDMTARRKDSMRRVNEWDWYAFYRNGFDLADGWRLAFDVGHVWYVYHGVRPVAAPYWHTMEEWYATVNLENPYVVPFAEGYYDHAVCKGAFWRAGLKRACALPYGLAFTPKLTVGGGTRNYNAVMYPPYDGSVGGGITYAELEGTLAYWFNDHFGVHAKIAYAVLTDREIRSGVREADSDLANQFVWGQVGMEFAF